MLQLLLSQYLRPLGTEQLQLRIEREKGLFQIFSGGRQLLVDIEERIVALKALANARGGGGYSIPLCVQIENVVFDKALSHFTPTLAKGVFIAVQDMVDAVVKLRQWNA